MINMLFIVAEVPDQSLWSLGRGGEPPQVCGWVIPGQCGHQRITGAVGGTGGKGERLLI